MRIGVDYYPEQWERSLWEKDADLMKLAGVKVVRMAEFAWSRLEPEEGRFDFKWLDEAIALFAERDIEVFLATPTATPPLWLFEKYPETIQVDKTGKRIDIGIRAHRCMNSPVFRTLSERIIRKMVERYRDEKMVIGYQIDNELEANHCCCPVCEEAFRTWIREKYGTVEAVNTAYGNSVWSGEYSDFSQVKSPVSPFQTWLNPSYQLDFNRYASDSVVNYMQFQRDLIRSIDPDALITTNTWFCENMPDFYDMFEGLDFVSYDNYPTLRIPEEVEELYSHAFHLDLMRGIKQTNFWIMEQLSGPMGCWMPMTRTTHPGMLKGYSLQAIAHGADAVVHFRWRSGVSGAEMFWHGLIDHSNVPGRRYQEFVELCSEVKGLEELTGSVSKNKVALLYGAEQEYAFKVQTMAEGMHYFEQLKSWHDAFTSIGVGVDIINQYSDISGYDIIVAPTLFVTEEAVVKNLYQAAESGSTVVLTNRSGVKDTYNKCIMQALPTVYTELMGIHITEYDPVGLTKKTLEITDATWSEKRKSIVSSQKRQDISAASYTQWCDLIECDNAEALAVYGEDFYQGVAAVTRNEYKNGIGYYIGTVLDRISYHALAMKLAEEKGLSFETTLPLGVEVTWRYTGDSNKGWRFVFNNTDKEQSFLLEEEEISLKPFEMKIQEKSLMDETIIYIHTNLPHKTHE